MSKETKVWIVQDCIDLRIFELFSTESSAREYVTNEYDLDGWGIEDGYVLDRNDNDKQICFFYKKTLNRKKRKSGFKARSQAFTNLINEIAERELGK